MPEKIQTAGDIQAQIFSALHSPSVQKTYANGFAMGNTSTDAFIVFMLNGQPTNVMNMSFETAKSLINDLSGLMQTIESQSKVKYLSAGEFEKAAGNQ